MSIDELLKNEENFCMNFEIAISQRETELAAGLGLKGTQGYEDKGCYVCDAYDQSCKSYFSEKMLEEIK